MGMRVTMMWCTLLAVLATTVLAADRLPSGPTHKEVLVATVQDAGKPFALRTNIYLPRGAAAAPTPLVLFIHGNGGAYNFSNGSRAYEFSIALAERGLAVATIDYRPDDALPGEIHDVKGYVRWFRAKAKDYNIDPDRIGVWAPRAAATSERCSPRAATSRSSRATSAATSSTRAGSSARCSTTR